MASCVFTSDTVSPTHFASKSLDSELSREAVSSSLQEITSVKLDTNTGLSEKIINMNTNIAITNSDTLSMTPPLSVASVSFSDMPVTSTKTSEIKTNSVTIKHPLSPDQTYSGFKSTITPTISDPGFLPTKSILTFNSVLTAASTQNLNEDLFSTSAVTVDLNSKSKYPNHPTLQLHTTTASHHTISIQSTEKMTVSENILQTSFNADIAKTSMTIRDDVDTKKALLLPITTDNYSMSPVFFTADSTNRVDDMTHAYSTVTSPAMKITEESHALSASQNATDHASHVHIMTGDISSGIISPQSIEFGYLSSQSGIYPTASYHIARSINPSLWSSLHTTMAVSGNLSVQTNKTANTTIHHKRFYNFCLEIEFTGSCKSLEKEIALKEMWSSVVNIVGHESETRGINIVPKNILCEPLRVSFNVFNTTHKNLTEILQSKIANNDFVITVLVDEYKIAFKATQVYPYSENDIGSDIFLMGLNEVDVIVIICATSISVLLVCAGLIICAREYYLKKRTRSFTLSSFVSKGSSSYDYSLTKMPRPNSTYSENGVRMKSMDNGDGQRSALLPIEEQETSVSDIQIRVNSNDNGIIVGVTGTGSNYTNHLSHDVSNEQVDQSDERLCSEQGDQSDEKLCPKNEDAVQSVDNPIYYADDERFLNV